MINWFQFGQSGAALGNAADVIHTISTESNVNNSSNQNSKNTRCSWRKSRQPKQDLQELSPSSSQSESHRHSSSSSCTSASASRPRVVFSRHILVAILGLFLIISIISSFPTQVSALPHPHSGSLSRNRMKNFIIDVPKITTHPTCCCGKKWNVHRQRCTDTIRIQRETTTHHHRHNHGNDPQ